MHFLSQDLEDYIEQHSEKEPAHLAALNKETYQKILLPRMLSGHFQGRVLSMLSKLIRPKNILEIGTYTGYSALCLCVCVRVCFVVAVSSSKVCVCSSVGLSVTLASLTVGLSSSVPSGYQLKCVCVSASGYQLKCV